MYQRSGEITTVGLDSGEWDIVIGDFVCSYEFFSPVCVVEITNFELNPWCPTGGMKPIYYHCDSKISKQQLMYMKQVSYIFMHVTEK